MRVILKTTDPVVLDFAEVLLRDAGIPAHVFDAQFSQVEGSLGVFPRRLAVSDDDAERARDILRDGLGGAKIEA